jgi:hypothetical protein
MPLPRSRSPRNRFPWLIAILCALPAGLLGAGPSSSLTLFGAEWEPFAFLTSSAYGFGEKLGLLGCLVVAVAGLGYAAWLMKQVYAADTGTPAMQKVAQAVREGANAYLRRQFTVVGILIVLRRWSSSRRSGPGRSRRGCTPRRNWKPSRWAAASRS